MYTAIQLDKMFTPNSQRKWKIREAIYKDPTCSGSSAIASRNRRNRNSASDSFLASDSKAANSLLKTKGNGETDEGLSDIAKAHKRMHSVYYIFVAENERKGGCLSPKHRLLEKRGNSKVLN